MTTANPESMQSLFAHRYVWHILSRLLIRESEKETTTRQQVRAMYPLDKKALGNIFIKNQNFKT